MNRTSIMLPELLKMKAIKLAKNEGVSLGELIRESLEMKLNAILEDKKRDCFFAEELVFSENVPDNLSEKHDDYLY